MKETFRSFVELLISIALDEDVMAALERANGEQTAFWTLSYCAELGWAKRVVVRFRICSNVLFQMSCCCHT